MSVTTVMTATFSEAMDPATIVEPPLNSRIPAVGPYLAVVAYDSATNTATLTPDSPLSNNTTYTAVVSGGPGGVSDVAGNVLASDVSWSFTSAVSSDTTPPAVNSTAPSSGATGVSIGTQVVAIFSEPMNPATITAATFTLNGVTAAVAYNGTTNTATLTPAAVLANATTYTARVVGGTSGVKDLAGIPMSADYTWSFTTASSSGGDTTPPTVEAVLPPNDAPAVSTGTRLTVTFSEAMTASTINTGTIELRNASNNLVSAAVTYDGAANRATVTPNSSLAVSSVYTATVKGGAMG